MAVTASGLFVITFRDVFDATGLDIDFDNDTLRGALIDNTPTPNFDTHDFWADLSGSEISGTGYTANGQTLTSPAVAVSSGALTFDWADPQWTTATITARALVVYDDTLTNDPLFALFDFGSDITSTAGTFDVAMGSPAVSIDLTP